MKKLYGQALEYDNEPKYAREDRQLEEVVTRTVFLKSEQSKEIRIREGRQFKTTKRQLLTLLTIHGLC